MTEESPAEVSPATRPEKTSPGLGMPASLYLQDFGQLVYDAFGDIPYHVGSSLVSNSKPSWRDVDVRLILDDDRYAADGYGDPERPHDNAKWVAMVKAFSMIGRQMTGLPIDFQIQQQTHANKHFGRATGECRSALFSLAKSRDMTDAYERGKAAAAAPEGESK